MTPKQYAEWEDAVYSIWDTLVGQEVLVRCQFTDSTYHGTLKKEKVDWDCAMKGQTIYTIMDEHNEDQILTPGDVVWSAKIIGD